MSGQTPEDVLEAIETLQNLVVPDFHLVGHEMRFVCWRKTLGSSAEQEVIVRVLDYGPAEGNQRFHATAVTADSRVRTGYRDASIRLALGGIQWSDLDVE